MVRDEKEGVKIQLATAQNKVAELERQIDNLKLQKVELESQVKKGDEALQSKQDQIHLLDNKVDEQLQRMQTLREQINKEQEAVQKERQEKEVVKK